MSYSFRRLLFDRGVCSLAHLSVSVSVRNRLRRYPSPAPTQRTMRAPRKPGSSPDNYVTIRPRNMATLQESGGWDPTPPRTHHRAQGQASALPTRSKHTLHTVPKTIRQTISTSAALYTAHRSAGPSSYYCTSSHKWWPVRKCLSRSV